MLQHLRFLFVLVTFRFSHGRTAERAASQLDHMVESLLLHRYSLALRTTLSSTVTIWCVFHVDCTALVTHTGVERHNAIRSRAQPADVTQLHYLSFPVGLTRDVRTQTVSLCSLTSTHQATTANASTQLSTVPLRLHEDLREAQTPSNTENAMAVTFADAATQLSFAEFVERCIFSKALPPRPSPVQPHLTSVCISSGFPTQCRFRRRYHPTPAHRVLSWVRPTPMPHWIDGPLSLRKGTLVALHFTISCTWMPLSVSAVPVVVTFAPLSHARSSTVHHRRHQVSRFKLPWYPCQSSARATPFATCSCLYLVRCVTHIHFSAVLAAAC